MVETRTCTHCGTALPPDAPQGVCPCCVLKLGSSAGERGNNPTSVYPPTAPLPSLEDLAALFPQLEIIGLVGRGGMGVVYKARQANLDRLVALKILPPEVGRDPTFAERFNREARALAKLTHPNIVAIYDSGERGGLYFFIMEYVDGVNLRQAILADQISPEKALAIVPQICDALQYAHEEGVVHRDIKPENVLLDKKGRVKVADFGLAKLLGMATRDITLTGTSQAMGTLHYMAPEQYEKPLTVDHRADIYSLGVVFYELLTGKLPLGRFELPSEQVKIDVRLDQVVLKTLEREPERRYQYVSEVKTDVERVRQVPPAAAAPLAAPAERIGRAERPPPRAPSSLSDSGRWMVVLGIIALCCLPLACVAGMLTPMMGIAAGWLVVFGTLIVMAGLLATGIILVAAGLNAKAREESDSSIPPEKQAFTREADREQAAKAVYGPSVGLVLIALLPVVIVLVLFLAEGDDLFNVPAMMPVLIVWLIQLIASAMMLIAALKLRRLRDYSLAMAGAIAALLPAYMGWPLGIPVGIWTLVVLMRREVRSAFGVDSAAPSSSPRPALLLAIACGAAPLVLFMVSCGGGYLSIRQAPTSHSGMAYKSVDHAHYGETTTIATPDMGNQPKIVWNDGVPEAGPGAIDPFDNLGPQAPQLDPEAKAAINEALKSVYADYLALEAQHASRKTNELGHQVITVKPFRKELSELEDRFWTEVDRVVTDNNLRGLLRENLPLRSEVFHHGDGNPAYEIWKVGAWYYYRFENSGGAPSRGPELPPHLKRLYEPPEEAEKAEDTTHATDH